MQSKLQINFFYILLICVAVIAFFIFLPYFQALLLGMVCAVIAYPLYQSVLRACYGAKSLSAIFTLIIVYVVIAIPIGVLMYLLFQEARSIYSYFAEGGGNIAMMDYVGRFQIFLNGFLPANLVPETTITDIQNYFNNIYSWTGDHFTSIFANTFTFIANLFLFLLSSFFFLRDGKKFRELILKLSPLDDVHDQRLLNHMAGAIRSVVKGSLLMALIQGFCLSLGMAIFGIQSPVLWGMLAVIGSLLPGIGAFIVIIPAAGYLFVTAGLWYGLGMLIWGMVIITITDNFLRPMLVGHGMKIHPFLVLVSVFGGISLFGVLGFIIGPIILSLFFALMEIHSDVFSVKASPVDGMVKVIAKKV